jgi:hypothetical protein
VSAACWVAQQLLRSVGIDDLGRCRTRLCSYRRLRRRRERGRVALRSSGSARQEVDLPSCGLFAGSPSRAEPPRSCVRRSPLRPTRSRRRGPELGAPLLMSRQRTLPIRGEDRRIERRSRSVAMNPDAREGPFCFNAPGSRRGAGLGKRRGKAGRARLREFTSLPQGKPVISRYHARRAG